MQEQGNENNKNVKPNNSIYIISAQGNIGIGVDGNMLSVCDVMRPRTDNKGEDYTHATLNRYLQ